MGCVPSTKCTKDYRSYLEGQGDKHRCIEMNWTATAARHHRREEIPVCGTRMPSSQRNRLDTSRWQEKKRQAKEDLAVDILRRPTCKRSQKERGGGSSGWSCTMAKPAAHCPENGWEIMQTGSIHVGTLSGAHSPKCYILLLSHRLAVGRHRPWWWWVQRPVGVDFGVKTLQNQDTSDTRHFGTIRLVPKCPDSVLRTLRHWYRTVSTSRKHFFATTGQFNKV